MTDLIRLAEWTVPDDEIDHLNHMSTVFYAQRSDQGVFALLAGLGATPEALGAAGLVAVVTDRHTLFRREQLAGSPLVLEGGVIAVGPGRLEVYAQMAHAGTGELAAMFRLGVELQARATRTPQAIPAAWAEAARAGRIEPPPRSAPRSLPMERMGAALTLEDFARAGVECHLRREIAAETCDADGIWAPFRPRKWTGPGGSPSQGVMDEIWGSVPGFVWPALEMRILTLGPVRQGDVLESYTALLAVSHKIMQSGIWVFEAKSRRLVSVIHQVNIFFNFATRRPQDMPAEVRARLEALARPQIMAGV